MTGPASATTCVIYARKSSEQEDRQVLSIDSQIREMRGYAERTGLLVEAVLVEAASAKRPGRLVFEELLASIQRGTHKVILAWHPDRLSRNALDAARLIDLMDQGRLMEIHTPSQVFRGSNPTDKFFLTFHWGQAKLENDNKSINVKRGLAEKARRGARPAPAPIGYLNDPLKPKGQKAILPDAERGPLVRRMFELVLAGTAPSEVRRRANDEWGLRTPHGHPLSRSSFYRMLTRPFYAGEFEYPEGSGTWHQGSHPPLLTLAEFDRVQAILGKDGRPRGRGARHFTYRGLLTCGFCHASITAEEKRKQLCTGDVRRYTYYHCTKKKDPSCTQRCVEEADLEAQILKAVESISVSPAFHAWALRCLDELARQDQSSSYSERASLERNIIALERKLDGLLDMRASGEITAEIYTAKSSRISRELARARERLAERAKDPTSWRRPIEDAIAVTADAVERYREGSPAVRAAILRDLGSNHLIRDKKLVLSADSTISAVARISREAVAKNVRFEPPQYGYTKSKTDPRAKVGLTWLRRWDDVRTKIITMRISG